MAKKLDFKDFLTVDYAPGMPDLIKKNAKKRKGDTGAGTNAEYSSRYSPEDQIDTIGEKTTDPIELGTHAKNVGMGYTGKHKTIKDPGSKKGRHVHVFQFTGEEAELDEVSQALAHKVAKARQAQASNLRQKAVDEPDMMKAFAHTKAANKAEKKAGQSYNRLMKKEEVELDEELKFHDKTFKDGSKVTDIFHKNKFVGSIGKHHPRNGRPEGYHVIQYKTDSIPKGSKNIHRHERLNSHEDAKKLVTKHFNEEVELDEAMTATHKKLAHDVHKQLKRDEPMGLAAGMKLKADHSMLRSKYGSDWRKKAGIKIVEETEEVDEALNLQQRRARGRKMKLKRRQIEVSRKRVLKRAADPKRLKTRAEKAARNAIFRRLAKGLSRDEVPPQRKQEIEKRMEKMRGRIKRLAIKLMPKVRKLDKERRADKEDK